MARLDSHSGLWPRENCAPVTTALLGDCGIDSSNQGSKVDGSRPHTGISGSSIERPTLRDPILG